VALYFRDDAEAIGPPSVRPPIQRPGEPEHDVLRERLAAAPCFFTDLLAELALAPEQLQEALWDLVWAGEVTNDAWAPLRAPRLTLARAQRSTLERRARAGRRFGSRRGGGAAAQVQGRWSLVSTLFRNAPEAGARRRTLAELLLERYGILTREQVLAEAVPGGFAILYDALGQLETLGACRRGYFIEGLGGAQFALPGAVERLRSLPRAEGSLQVLAATDPANPYGATLSWPKLEGQRRPARTAGAYVMLRDGDPLLYVERGGKGILRLQKLGDGEFIECLGALAEAAQAGQIEKLAIEKVDGEAVIGSGMEAALIEAGFRRQPRKLVA
jgi:ATP-dependent helicase Lhr and Lhr-like helicase